MDFISQFTEVKCKTLGMEIHLHDDWELVFFDNRKRARLLKEGDVRFKSVEFDSIEELFNLFSHDPVFRGEVSNKFVQLT